MVALRFRDVWVGMLACACLMMGGVMALGVWDRVWEWEGMGILKGRFDGLSRTFGLKCACMAYFARSVG